MRGITRMTLDTCGGEVLEPPQSTVFANGMLVAVLDTPIEGHGSGRHAKATMSSASEDVFAEGIGICREDDT